MEPIVQNHKQRSLEMKTIYFLLCIGLLFTSCSSVPTSNIYSTNSIQTTDYVEKAISDDYSISSQLFDTLQSPLSFTLSSQCKPITRQNWEYHMAGIGWWDIYLMTGRKLGNGIYEKSIENKSNCKIVELHNTRTQYDNSVLSVEVIFVSSDKAVLETFQSDFQRIATQFTGTQATNENEGIKRWNAGWIHYTSYPIQYHESGKWIYLISSFDSVHSPY